ncbi:hypothetical protein QJS82_08570 [Psychrobacter maritimus]|uniref:hypothetical protein n=1 Tax=Psychrobacter maritimus TaxID=256325 RepID=UPI00248CF000|nr:hypothetical protein [Psychrobacter sp. WB2]WGV12257.1 hypothetical protein QJS82_08570 [Psychrobacter sp. WB2]
MGRIINILDNEIDESIGSIFGLAKINDKNDRFFKKTGKSKYCKWVELDGLFDTAPLIRKSIAIKYPFPVHEEEKYMAESWLSNHIDKTHFSYFVNQYLMRAEYQEDGLSAQSLKLRTCAPINAMSVYSSYLDSEIRFIKKARYVINYWRFYYHAKDKYQNIRYRDHINKYFMFTPFGKIFFLVDKYIAKR